MSDVQRWSKPLSIAGGATFVAGSIDPMEGSVLILLGSALLALGSYVERRDGRVLAYRTWSLALVALGVGALWMLSAMGGVGGSSGRSGWWALLFLPYPIGWALDLWGPGVARWMSVAGIAIGTWYIAILAIMLSRAGERSIVPSVVIAAVGIATIAICATRLARRTVHSDEA